MSNSNIYKINQKIVECQKCARLRAYTEKVALEKVKRFRDQEYWGKPVPGFGDPEAKVIIIGLAPAAHGANRTGRMFTGDSSGDWLYRALFETGFANQPESYSIDDGLILKNVYINAVIHCAPPQNKPQKDEIENCREYLIKDLQSLVKGKVLIALGQIAFKEVCKIMNLRGLTFGHLKIYDLSEDKKLICSYHPSRQNTQTGKLKWNDWIKVFETVKIFLS